MITINSLTKYYGKKKILDGLNLTLNKGEVVGIAGKNGAGKSTLFRCIIDMEQYTGDIKSPYTITKNHIAFVPDNQYFFPKMKAIEYLQLLLNNRQLYEKDIERKNIFDLPFHEYIEKYSTGMKKKLTITGALIQKNDYFIFDEPFNGLDLDGNIILTEIIHRLKALQKGVLLSSHIFPLLKEVCDIMYLLEDGQITLSANSEDFDKIENELRSSLIFKKLDELDM